MTQEALAYANDDEPFDGSSASPYEGDGDAPVVPIYDPGAYDSFSENWEETFGGFDMAASDAHEITMDDELHEQSLAGRHLHLVLSDGLTPLERAEKMLADREHPFNEDQLEVIRHDTGPMLALAGAGSGKTTTLISRVAYLVLSEKAAPSEILTITFTRKVAQELEKRLREQVGLDVSTTVSAGTYHWLAGSILRAHAGKIGRSPQFKVCDEKESIGIIKQYMSDADKALVDTSQKSPAKWIRSQISWAKNRMLTREEFLARDPSRQREMVCRVWEEYEHEKERSDCLDFDDMLVCCVDLLRNHPSVLEAYQRRWKYIQVDEYQDTNRPQYQMIKLLSGMHRNLLSVGDDQQAVYGFRGSDVRNIRGFMRDYPEAKRAHLKINYRSTAQIIAGANQLVSHASERLVEDGMLPGPAMGDGPTPMVRMASSSAGVRAQENEMLWIARQIKAQIDRWSGEGGGPPASEIAVLCRIRWPLDELAKVLGTMGVPHRMLTGHGFYERLEVRTALAHLALVINPSDEGAFLLAVSSRVGVAEATASKVIAYAQGREMDYLEAGSHVYEMTGVNRPAKAAVSLFCSQMRAMREKVLADEGISLSRLLREIIYLPEGLAAQIKAAGAKAAQEAIKENEERAEQELDTLEDILVVARHYEREEEHPSLVDFLARVSLNNGSQAEDADDRDRVVLGTAHGAKGLEWDTVIVMGMEEEMFPSGRAMETEEGLEEERRLAYVAMTRARRVLVLTYAAQRRGRARIPSRFIAEAGLHLT